MRGKNFAAFHTVKDNLICVISKLVEKRKKSRTES